VINNLNGELCEYYKETKWRPPKEEWPPNQPKSIVSVALIHYNNNRRTHQELIEISERFKTGAPAVDKLVSSHSRVTKDISKIFTADPTENRLPKRILIEGAPGIGKTVLAKEIVYRWANGELFQGCELVFLVYLRNPQLHKIKSLEDILQIYIPNKALAVDTAKYLETCNGEKVAFVFDGYDEFPTKLQRSSIIADIIEGEKGLGMKFCNSIVVVTSRPTATFYLHHRVNRRIEILGLAKEEREEYISISLNDSHDQKQKLDKYLKYHPVINSLCFIPLYLVILMFLFQVKESLPATLTEMNESFVVYTICRYLVKEKIIALNDNVVKKLADLPTHVYKFIQTLSKLAFEGLENSQLVFTLEDLKNIYPNIRDIPGAINGFGLLQAVPHYATKGVAAGSTMSFNFLHFTMQEYLAAFYVSNLSVDKQLSLMEKIFWDSRFNFMWMMYVGIVGIKSKAFSSFVDGNTFSSCSISSRSTANQILLNVSQNDKRKCLHLFQCYVEAKSDVVPDDISSIFSGGNIRLTNLTLLPHHISSLVAFMSASTKQQWKTLDLGNCSLRSIGMSSLLEHVIKSKENISLLEYVDLSGNGESPWSVYCAIIRCCRSNRLTLCGDDGMEEYNKEIVDSVEVNRGLESLTLCRVGKMGLKSVKKFFASINNRTLKEVNLSWNKTSVKDIGVFKIPCNHLPFESGLAMSNTVIINVLYDSHHKCSPSLVDLSGMNISDAAVLLIVFGLCNNTTVQKLNISASTISNDGIKTICASLTEKSCLQEFNLSRIRFRTNFSFDHAKHIAEIIQHNATLIKLNISNSHIPNDGIVTISKSLMNNNTLKEIDMSYNQVSTEGANMIAEVIQTNVALQKFDISFCDIPSKGAAVISKAYKTNKTMQELKISLKNDRVTINTAVSFLDLSSNNIGDAGALIVSDILCNSMVNICKLNISFNGIRDNGVMTICDCMNNSNTLQELNISHNKISAYGASHIAEAIQGNTTLLRLNVSACNIPNDGVTAIIKYLKNNSTLEEFYCRHNTITVEGVNKITELIQINETLRIIDIAYCGIPNEGAILISKSCRNSRTLQELIISWIDIECIKAKREEGYVVNTSELHCDLSGLNIGDTGVQIISNLLFDKLKAKTLDISNNNILDILAIGDCLKSANRTLQEFNLSHNKINVQSAMEIAEIINLNTTLQKLDVSKCGISNDGILTISESLRVNVSLQELNMSYNCINFKGAIQIAKAINVNKMLKKINISYCCIPDDGAIVISEAYENNQILFELIISWKNDKITINTADSSCNLSDKNIDETGALILSHILYDNQKIKKVDLSFNNLHDNAIALLNNCLKSNNTLEELILSNNKITSKGIEVIFDAVWSNGTLKILNISFNNIGTDGAIIISKSLKNKGTLENLYISGMSTEESKIIQDTENKNCKCIVHYI